MAGTISLSQVEVGEYGRIVATCTGDAANGSYPATAIPKFSGELLTLITNPGSTAPTDDFDITLIDGDGLDRLQGVGANRDTANSEQVQIVYSSSTNHPPVAWETLTLTIANNSVNSAGIVITLYYRKT